MTVKLLAWRGNDKKLSKKQVKQVSKIVNKTKKYKLYYDGTTASLSSLLNTWNAIYGVNTGFPRIVEGDESYQRQGDTIMCKHMKITLNSIEDLPTPAVARVLSYWRIVVCRLFGKYSGIANDYFQDKDGGTTGTLEEFVVEKGTVLLDKVITSSYYTPQKTSFRVPMKSSKIPHTLIQFGDDDPPTVEKNNIMIFSYPLGPATPDHVTSVNITGEIGFYDKY